MNSSLQRRALELLDQVLQLPDDQVPRYLDEICGDEGELREAVESLLSTMQQQQDFLSSGPLEETLARTTSLTHHQSTPLSQLVSRINATRRASPDSHESPREQVELCPGVQIDDFEIVQTLGKGAFAHVYLARQLSMSRLVALKVSRYTGDEPQTLAQFDHPNIVRVFDQRQLPDSELNLLYMQFHPGGTLADAIDVISDTAVDSRDGKCLLRSVDKNLLDRAQAVPTHSLVRQWIGQASCPKIVAWMGIQIARALQTAHHRGLLHRDVKPANILLTAEGIPQLADFNVSASSSLAGQESTLGGSAAYMAPEHLRAILDGTPQTEQQVRERADLYSLAIVLWELWQGTRPFPATPQNQSLIEMLKVETELRQQALCNPAHSDSASDRVLESVLRSTLSLDASQRPASGTELAGRLRLALFPEAAKLFLPDRHSVAAKLWGWSPAWLVGLAVLIPNAGAGLFNYIYNQNSIMNNDTRAGLSVLATWVNAIAFPVAIALILWRALPLVRGLGQAKSHRAVTAPTLEAAINLGHHAALIGGAFWTLAGIIYPVLLWLRFPDFSGAQSVHFFVSLLVCGGVAMIYPFFALTLLTSAVYYPGLVKPTMQDQEFERHQQRTIRRSESYLLIATLVPLLGASLLVSGNSQSRWFLSTAILAGVVGLIASFRCYRRLVEIWNRLDQVLSTSSHAVPGE